MLLLLVSPALAAVNMSTVSAQREIDMTAETSSSSIVIPMNKLVCIYPRVVAQS